jgi:hypothetical protein
MRKHQRLAGMGVAGLTQTLSCRWTLFEAYTTPVTVMLLSVMRTAEERMHPPAPGT